MCGSKIHAAFLSVFKSADSYDVRAAAAPWKSSSSKNADDALMVRETDNRDKVTAILNLSDGMLSDFLCLHVICTINCSAADIDHALLRPGRLVSHRVFRRLDIAQAFLPPASLGKSLPPPPTTRSPKSSARTSPIPSHAGPSAFQHEMNGLFPVTIPASAPKPRRIGIQPPYFIIFLPFTFGRWQGRDADRLYL
jgi:hypothetical protein